MNDAKTWPPKALNENAIGAVYNHAYDQASCERGDSVEEAHNEACHAVYKHGFHNATGGREEHPALTELREAAKDVVEHNPPGTYNSRNPVNRLNDALAAFAKARGEGLCTCTDGSCAREDAPT
jgi:hypothetical protein